MTQITLESFDATNGHLKGCSRNPCSEGCTGLLYVMLEAQINNPPVMTDESPKHVRFNGDIEVYFGDKVARVPSNMVRQDGIYVDLQSREVSITFTADGVRLMKRVQPE